MGSGLQTAALVYGGSAPTASPYLNAVEQYDGSTWTTTSGLTTNRRSLGGSSNSPYSSVLAFGGYGGSNTNSTEEFTGETITARAVKTVDFD